MDHIHQITWDGLKEGYGVEDIAKMHNAHVHDVRQCVRHFRSQPQKLASMYARARQVWAAETKKTPPG